MDNNENNDARPVTPETPAPETPAPEPPRAPEGFVDASYIPRDQAPRAPRSYNYAGPEMRENRQRWEEEERSRAKKARRRGVGAGWVLALCLIFLIGGVVGGLFLSDSFNGLKDRLFSSQSSVATPVPQEALPSAEPTAEPSPEPTAEPTATPAQAPVFTPGVSAEGTMAATEIYQLACQQAVGISTAVTYNTQFGAQSGTVTGSGFIISADGYILTNYHVIEYAAEGGYPITVMLYNGDTYTAQIVGYEDDDNDIAVLKIDAAGLNAATLGDSTAMQVGETIYAVGNPLGELDYTMTPGIVSAKDREITTTDSSTGLKSTINMFQISAAVNSGNSGGPVYNSRGQVIGIVTAKYSDTYAEMGIEGLGFAIPIDDATAIASDLIANGYVRGKAYLGVSTKTINSTAAQYYSLVEGAYVAAVVPGTCAESAGLQVSDVITAVDKTPIASSAALQAALKNYAAGDEATVTVYRAGETLTLPVVFDEKQPESTAAASSGVPSGFGGTPW